MMLLGTTHRANGVDGGHSHRESWRVLFASLVLADERLIARVCLSPDGEAGRGEHGGPLRTLRYDVEADEIEVGVGPEVLRGAVLRFFVHAPRSIVVEATGQATRVRVLDADGLQTVIDLSRAELGAAGALPGAASSDPAVEPGGEQQEQV